MTTAQTAAAGSTGSHSPQAAELVLAGETGFLVVVLVEALSQSAQGSVVEVVAGETGFLVVVLVEALSQSPQTSVVEVVLVVAGTTGLLLVEELVQSAHGSTVVVFVVAGATGLVVVEEEVQSSQGASVGSTGLVVVVVVVVLADSHAMAEEAMRVVANKAEVDLTIMIDRRDWLVLKE